MESVNAIQLFEGKQIRVEWDAKQEKYWFSIVDVIAVLNDSDHQAARKYWKVLKGRLIKEGFEVVTNCYQLKFKTSQPQDNEREPSSGTERRTRRKNRSSGHRGTNRTQRNIIATRLRLPEPRRHWREKGIGR